MLFQELEKHHKKNEDAIEKLSLQIEIHNHLAEELLQELRVSSEQLTAFMEKKEAFTEANWEILLSQKKSMEEKLQRDLANVRDPLRIKKSRDSLNIQPQWISVR